MTIKTSWKHRWTLAKYAALGFVGWLIIFRVLLPIAARIQTASTNTSVGVAILIMLAALVVAAILLIVFIVKYLAPLALSKERRYERYEKDVAQGEAEPEKKAEEKKTVVKEKFAWWGWWGWSWKIFWVAALLTLLVILFVRFSPVAFVRHIADETQEWIAKSGSRTGTPPPEFRQASAVENYSLRWSKDDPHLDHSYDETDEVPFVARPGAFEGWARVPRDWADMWIEKSQNQGDWIAIWCNGRTGPSRIYYWYETLPPGAFDYCYDNVGDTVITFRLEGQGSLIFHRTKRKLGVSMTRPEETLTKWKEAIGVTPPKTSNPEVSTEE